MECKRSVAFHAPRSNAAPLSRQRSVAGIVLLHVAAWLVVTAFGMTANAERDHVIVQAHRGYSEIYPENTLLAIERAFDAGADRVETDLAITGDGHVVLMHDRTVDRTTDGSGRVSSLTLDELRQLDAGSWKDDRFTGERIPTLREALEAADGRGELNLEVKSNNRSIIEVADVVEAAVRTVKDMGAEDRVVFSSFDFRALDMVLAEDPELRVLIIDWSQGGRGSGLELALAKGYYGVALAAEFATQERIVRAKAGGLFVHIGTRPRPQIDQWVAWGVDGFSADDPEALVDYLERKGYLE